VAFTLFCAATKESPSDSTLEGKFEYGQYLYTQHAVIKIGAWQLQFFPRFSAALVALAGIVLLLIGLYILLHVPTPPYESVWGPPKMDQS
jgi:hypothetical protein